MALPNKHSIMQLIFDTAILTMSVLLLHVTENIVFSIHDDRTLDKSAPATHTAVIVHLCNLGE